MEQLGKPLLLLVVVLAVPMVPFLLWGEWFEAEIGRRFDQQVSSALVAPIVVLLLAADILLPIPSSVVSTYGGAHLGWLVGTGASWLGMSLGATAGFGVARRWGRRIALRLTTESDLEGMQRAVQHWGPLLLIVTRALPVVAEASVLLFGVNRLRWGQFLPPVLLSNLGIAVAYSMFGDWAQQHSWLPWALAMSLALPVLVGTVARRYLVSRHRRASAGEHAGEHDGQ